MQRAVQAGCVCLPLENPQTCTEGLAVKVRGRGHPSLPPSPPPSLPLSLPRSLPHPPGAPACTLSSCSHYSSCVRVRHSFSVSAHPSVHACRKVVSRVPSLLRFLFTQSLSLVHMHFFLKILSVYFLRASAPRRASALLRASQ